MYSDLHLENISDLVIYILIKLSQIISTVINPLVVAPITFGLLIYHDQTHIPRHLLFFISILFTTILPFFTIIYYKKLGKLSAYDAPLRQERIELLVIAAIYNATGFILLDHLGASQLIKGLMFCYAINTAIVWGITIYWKISIHMVGIGGPIIALWFSGFDHPIIMGVIIILVGIARIIVRAHTPAQVITGTIFAMVLAYVELTLFFL